MVDPYIPAAGLVAGSHGELHDIRGNVTKPQQDGS
jgi:hypothetical protein